jgi:glutathione S-transferase
MHRMLRKTRPVSRPCLRTLVIGQNVIKEKIMTSTLRILGRRPSINVRKVLWTLDEVDRAYQFDVWEDALSPTQIVDLHTLNPNAQFPILVDASAPLWESNTICRYVAGEAGREDLLPNAPRARANVECWMDWQATDLNDAWRYAFLALQRRKPGYTDTGAISASIQAWNGKMAIVDAQIERTGAFVAGDRFTLADIVLGLSVHRWLGTPIERPDLPNVAAYYERLRTRPHFPTHANEDLI